MRFSVFNVGSDALRRLRFWSREVLLWTALPPALASDRLRALINRDIGSLRSFEVIRTWTLFGRVDDGKVQIEAFGPFRGLAGLGGLGAWQPVGLGPILGIAFLTVRGRAQDAYLVELLAKSLDAEAVNGGEPARTGVSRS